jgi:hypothetical protein
MSWIVIPKWTQFQHYGLYRRPGWIKNYTYLLHKDEYLDQPLAARGLLHGIWLAYADRDGRLRRDDLPATLLARARGAHLDSLNHAGLIDFSASKPLPLSLKPYVHSSSERANGSPTTSQASGSEFELPDVAVDEEMLELAHGWLHQQR